MSEQDESTSVASQIELQLSAFADGELTAAEAEFLSRRVSGDAALRRRLCQYYLIGSVVRGERSVPTTFASGLAGRLGDGSVDAAGQDAVASEDRAGWRRLIGGGAIAAGVALLALAGLNQTVATSRSTVAGNTGVSTAPTYTVPSLTNDALQPQISLEEPRLVNYMLRHGQLATPLIVETDLNAATAQEPAPCSNPGAAADGTMTNDCAPTAP